MFGHNESVIEIQAHHYIGRLMTKDNENRRNQSQAHVAEDLEVLGVDAEGLFVGLDGFGVVLGGAVEEAVDVPAHVGSMVDEL